MNSTPAPTLEHENLQLLSTVHLLDAQLQAAKIKNVKSHIAERIAYSAMLEENMAARLEDGTPVISLALAHTPEMRERYENVFLG